MNRLQETAFQPLPTTEIRPGGWLRRQLRLQADSLSGALDRFWPDIRDSRWFGGEAEGWERAPYWLDGVVPMAYLLGDAELIANVQARLEAILSMQGEDGWLGPRDEGTGRQGGVEHYDIWGLFLMLKVLLEYEQACPDPRIEPAVEACLRRIEAHIDPCPIFNWAMFRWFEPLLAIYWLHERRPQDWLPRLAIKLRAQGFDWQAYFERWPETGPTALGRWNYMSHIVNNAMALKAGALFWRLSGEEGDRRAHHAMWEALDRHHGMATGMFTGDECLAGTDPRRGTELCAVVDAAWSQEVLMGLLGEPEQADRLEQLIYNCLPATFSPDMWSHQYLQQSNQIECSIREGRPWNSNGPDANIFGLEPNFGCCTSNLSQGWTKFIRHLWMRRAGGGLAALGWGPCRVATEVGGVALRVEVETDYPFREEIKIRLETEGTLCFPLWLRVPGWCTAPQLRVDGEAVAIEPGPGFARLEREWSGTAELELRLPMAWRWLERPGGARALARGPLIFSLALDEEWRAVHTELPHREPPHGDWEVLPTSPWNYALEAETVPELEELELGEHPFRPDAPPLRAWVDARRVPGWTEENGSTGPMPESPLREADCAAERERIALIPYGCTNLRMTEFPVLASNGL